LVINNDNILSKIKEVKNNKIIRDLKEALEKGNRIMLST